MRYIIIGAGAVGGAIGGRLFESGHETLLIARGAHQAALRDQGLRLVVPDGTLTLPVPVADGPESVELRPDDVLILAVKTQDSVAALEAWAGRPVAGRGGDGTAGERLPLVCAQNGVENERLALRRFRRVYGCCVWLPATYLEAGVVQAAGVPLTGILHLGRYPYGTDETLRRISADLEKSLFGAPVREDVMRWKYGKLLSNLGNAVEAICGTEPGHAAKELYARARAEGEEVLTAAEIPFATRDEQAAFRGRQVDRDPRVPRSGGSTWQSLTRGAGSIEVDYLNGEIALRARRLDVPAPVNETLQREANRFARAGVRPGSLTAEDLLTLISRA